MRCSKVVLVLIAGMSTVAALDASSITIRQTGNDRIAFEVEYNYNGKNYKEFSGYFSSGENRTIDIPGKAVEIHLNVCSSWEKFCKDQIFTKFYHSPVSKCFTLYEAHHYTEEPYCQKLPAGGYSISVHQAGNYKAMFEVMYKYNGSKLTNSSGELTTGQNQTIHIPDKATNVTFTLYGYRGTAFSKDTMATKFYPLPVKKCFEIYGDGFFSKRWFEKPCQKLPAVNGNLISVRQTGDYKVILHVVYNYDGSELTESSGTFSKGEKRTIPVPDKATNIKATLFKDDSFGKMEPVFTQSYPSPVKKCYKVQRSSIFNDWSEEVC